MRNPVILAALLMAAGQAQAENLNAHEHGVMNLMLAQDGHEVTVELEAAADSFLGFEYQPVTEQEQQALADLVELLNQPQRLISLAAGCRLTDVDQALPFAPAHKHEHKSEHDHESEYEHESEHNHESEHHHDEHEEKHDHDSEHHHDEEHDHDAEHHHDDDHDHYHEDDHKAHPHSSHTDIRVSYQFNCEGQKVSPTQLMLFKELPHLEHLRIESISERRTLAEERTADGELEW
ncbi:ZrgA family zinc uptake protein [Oceanospirillum sediminis]|uniref:DUF2796 domain-containing protein n=1 Tax=Oceanospirillum sediminis TaxID=2760088 RepID=A0A839IMK7_9GAMM|nr:DUF2796 domain-containing protein [Oceanospirillum sediminis]MBB1485950.1 DUF2796 domain-containing protein [Oceanospirillum sediminis]